MVFHTNSGQTKLDTMLDSFHKQPILWHSFVFGLQIFHLDILEVLEADQGIELLDNIEYLDLIHEVTFQLLPRISWFGLGLLREIFFVDIHLPELK